MNTLVHEITVREELANEARTREEFISAVDRIKRDPVGVLKQGLETYLTQENPWHTVRYVKDKDWTGTRADFLTYLWRIAKYTQEKYIKGAPDEDIQQAIQLIHRAFIHPEETEIPMTAEYREHLLLLFEILATALWERGVAIDISEDWEWLVFKRATPEDYTPTAEEIFNVVGGSSSIRDDIRRRINAGEELEPADIIALVAEEKHTQDYYHYYRTEGYTKEQVHERLVKDVKHRYPRAVLSRKKTQKETTAHFSLDIEEIHRIANRSGIALSDPEAIKLNAFVSTQLIPEIEQLLQQRSMDFQKIKEEIIEKLREDIRGMIAGNWVPGDLGEFFVGRVILDIMDRMITQQPKIEVILGFFDHIITHIGDEFFLRSDPRESAIDSVTPLKIPGGKEYSIIQTAI